MLPPSQKEIPNPNLLIKIKRIIRQKFFPMQMKQLSALQEEYFQFHKGNIIPWKQYPSYLLIEDALRLQSRLKEFKKAARKYRFWFSDIVKPLRTWFQQDTAQIQDYNKNYLAYELKKNQQFFNGDESKAKIGLNGEQITAILVNERNNLLVAGPGSGKTRVITERAAFFHLKKGIDQKKHDLQK